MSRVPGISSALFMRDTIDFLCIDCQWVGMDPVIYWPSSESISSNAARYAIPIAQDVNAPNVR